MWSITARKCKEKLIASELRPSGFYNVNNVKSRWNSARQPTGQADQAIENVGRMTGMSKGRDCPNSKIRAFYQLTLGSLNS